MVNWGNAGRIAGEGFHIVSNAIGVPLDYMAGKAEGEDDFRAGAGAVASGLGGWGGATQGAASGAALGTIIAPGVGTAIGGVIGGIAGGMAGGFAGGWTADRADELVRGKQALASTNTGKNNMSQAVKLNNGDVAKVDDNGNIVGWLIKGGVAVAGINAAYNIANELRQNPINPMQTYQGYQQLNDAINPVGIGQVNNMAAAQSAAGVVGGQLRGSVGQGLRNSGNTIGRVWNAIPGSNAMKASVGLGVVADQLTGGNLSRGVGRAIGGGADFVTNKLLGWNTDFDGQNPASQQAMKDNREQQRVEQNRSTFNPYNDEIYQRGLQNQQDAEALNNRLFERDKNESWKVANRNDDIQRRNYLTNFTANQANALLQGYMTDIPNSVSNSLRTVFSARYN
jgi:hypothetical protein